MENNEIKLVAIPKIEHRLKEMGANVTKRIDELNINNLVATEETVKSLKELRADLNKELTAFEEQRKMVKGGILNPYEEFEKIYKSEISEKYTGAINLLKDKIASVESRIKDEKKSTVKAYFDELCVAERIDFLSFDRTGIEINLSTSVKAYKDKCNEIVNRTIDDLNLIRTTEFEAEILTEYKRSLNASQAITLVKDRKQKEKEEAARLHQIEVNGRISRVKAIGMTFEDMVQAYIYVFDINNTTEISITKQFLETASKEEFSKKVFEIEEAIKAKKRSVEQKPTESAQPVQPAAPVSAPIEKPKENLVKASFEVTGTMAQLKALGQYMKDNNITYKNI